MCKTFQLMIAVLIGTAHGAMIQKQLAARSLAAAGLPDPHCKTGIISLELDGKPRSCCAGYCGACNDYESCKSVRGQDSENACCASKVFEMRCGNAPANVCLKKCSESVPPCVMDVDIDAIETPKVKTVKGVPPCGDVVPQARAMHTNAVEKGDALTDIHTVVTKLDEAVSFAKAAQAKAKTDLENPDIPDDYKAKLEAETKHAQTVIDFVAKHRQKTEEAGEAVKSVISWQEIPKDVQLKIREASLEAGKDDKEAVGSFEKMNSLHGAAYMAVFKIAKKAADEAAAEAAKKKEAAEKKAAEEKAAKEAAAAAKAAAAKAAAEKKAAEEKAAKEAAAAAAKAAKEAAAAAKAAKEAKAAAAEAARKEAEAKKAAEPVWVATPGNGINCDRACSNTGNGKCMSEPMQAITSEKSITAAFAKAGHKCTRFFNYAHHVSKGFKANWPWADGGMCAYSSDDLWVASCAADIPGGYKRLCACKPKLA